MMYEKDRSSTKPARPSSAGGDGDRDSLLAGLADESDGATEPAHVGFADVFLGRLITRLPELDGFVSPSSGGPSGYDDTSWILPSRELPGDAPATAAWFCIRRIVSYPWHSYPALTHRWHTGRALSHRTLRSRHVWQLPLVGARPIQTKQTNQQTNKKKKKQNQV